MTGRRPDDRPPGRSARHTAKGKPVAQVTLRWRIATLEDGSGQFFDHRDPQMVRRLSGARIHD